MLEGGFADELSASDDDVWVTVTTTPTGQTLHGLKRGILAWNPVTRRCHELIWMDIRVDA